jgi:hypothetical protein
VDPSLSDCEGLPSIVSALGRVAGNLVWLGLLLRQG